MRFIAFLRPINVGGRNVKMEQLRRIFESVALLVSIVIASGNVVFDSKAKSDHAIEKKLEAELEKSLGCAVEMAEIARSKPLKKIPKRNALHCLCLTRYSDSKFFGASLEKNAWYVLTVRDSGTIARLRWLRFRGKPNCNQPAALVRMRSRLELRHSNTRAPFVAWPSGTRHNPVSRHC